MSPRALVATLSFRSNRPSRPLSPHAPMVAIRQASRAANTAVTVENIPRAQATVPEDVIYPCICSRFQTPIAAPLIEALPKASLGPHLTFFRPICTTPSS